MKYWIVILFTFSICTSQEAEYIDSTKVRNPRIAWKLGVLPGLGQIYNGKYVKAMGFMGAEYFVVTRFMVLKNENRIGLSFGHISNANIGDNNPGVEILSLSYQVAY